MTRLEGFLGRENTFVATYPEDIKVLRKGIEELEKLTDYQIEILYREYSDEFCASWLMICERSVDSFKDWPNEELKSGFYE